MPQNAPAQPGMISGAIQFQGTTPTAPTQSAPRPLLPAGIAIIVFLAGIVWMVVGISTLLAISVTQYLGSVPTFVDLTGQSSALLEVGIGFVVVLISFGLWYERQWALVLTLLFLLFEMVVYGLALDFLSVPFILSFLLFIALAASGKAFR
jgi:hypothetical protein